MPNEPWKLGGVNKPFVARRAQLLPQHFLLGVGKCGLMSRSVNVWRANGAGFVGNGCVGDVCSPGTSDCGTRALLDRPDRLAALAIEHEQEAVLRRLRDDFARAAAVADRQQLRRLRQVVVPKIVVHELLMPEPAAGARVERDERVREEIVALAIAAEEVVARGAERDEDDAVLFVDGHLAPVVDAAGRRLGALRPRVVTELALVRDAVEDPLELAGHDVVSLHVAGRRCVTRALRRQRHDHEVADDAARVAGVQRPHVRDVPAVAREAVAQIDAALFAEALDDR